jgi:DNA helicase II / ATP-dependent DNA helicase PcrA
VSQYLSELNQEQKNATTHVNGPLIIIAGAGSGKTRVLTYRIVHLMHQGIDPFQILALTFTNKAAREMKERIANILGSAEARYLWMGTFHSIFARILRIEAEHLNYPSNFTIYDAADSKNVIKMVLAEMQLDDKTYAPSAVLGRISNAKSNLKSWQQYMDDPDALYADTAAKRPYMGQIFRNYQKRLEKAFAMDFDDLLVNFYRLLHNFPEMLLKYQQKFKYLLVDEYQDTNHAQYVILKMLAARNENICVVGDDAQSIYAFRGATIRNILNFQRDYPDAGVYKLEQNYRSTSTIVNAANTLIKHNEAQIPKKVWTENEEGEKIKLLRCLSDTQESQMVANSIFEDRAQKQLKYSDFGILYRTNAQSRTFEESLRRLSIPYRIYGGLSFYQRKEIKDLLAYFRLAVNLRDEEALVRIINYPAREIGKTTLERLIVAAADNDIGIWDIISVSDRIPADVKSGTRNRISDFVTMISSFHAQLKSKDAYELATLIANSSGLLKELYNDKTPEGVSRYENIQELLNATKDFVDREEDVENSEMALPRTLDLFLQEIALLTDADKDSEEDKDRISLMTVHMAKGLEFKHVYVVGLEDGLFPSQMSLFSRDEVEEERRLFYVAITRAQQKLTLAYALNRYRYGKLTPGELSRFVDEIDDQYIDVSAGLAHESNPFHKSRPQPTIAKKPAAPPLLGQKKLISLKKAGQVSVGNLAEESALHLNLQTGMVVEHVRFGRGKVLQLEGSGQDKKATIFFEGQGSKQILLRFARLNIVE